MMDKLSNYHSTFCWFYRTVVGMIKAFEDIKMANDISPAVVAGGISQALLTTALVYRTMIMQVSHKTFLYQ